MNKGADGVKVARSPIQANRSGSFPTSALPLFAVKLERMPQSPRDFRIVEIGLRLARDLNRHWHSLLPRTDLGNLRCGNTSVAYAAEFEDRYYAVAIFSQPIIRSVCDGHTIELRRLAICEQAPKNTASRMLGVMTRLIKARWPFIDKLVSYQAVDVHAGTIYKAAGWRPVGEIVSARPQRFSGVNPKTRATGPLQTKSRKLRWELNI